MVRWRARKLFSSLSLIRVLGGERLGGIYDPGLTEKIVLKVLIKLPKLGSSSYGEAAGY